MFVFVCVFVGRNCDLFYKSPTKTRLLFRGLCICVCVCFCVCFCVFFCVYFCVCMHLCVCVCACVFICAGALGKNSTIAKFRTTTEVYPDSVAANDEQCNKAQVAAITAALDFILQKDS